MRTARVFFLDYILVTVPKFQCVYMSLPYMCDIKVVPRIKPGCAFGIKMIDTCVLPLEKQLWRPVMRKYHYIDSP